MHDYESKTRGIPRTYRGDIDPGALNLRIILLAGAAIGAILILVSNVSSLFVPPLPQAAPPALVAATATPVNALAVAIVAYNEPDGTIIGPIEAGRGYRVLEQRPDGWIWLDVDGSGAIWTHVEGGEDGVRQR